MLRPHPGGHAPGSVASARERAADHHEPAQDRARRPRRREAARDPAESKCDLPIEHLGAYATSYRYPTSAGRIKAPPDWKLFDVDAAGVDDALAAVAKHLGITI